MFYEATLLTNRKVLCRLTSTEDEQLVMKTIGANENVQSLSAPKHIIQELIKMMLVEVDGKPVTYQELSPLDNFFTIKEVRQLELFYNQLHVPSVAEDDSFLLSIKPISTTK